jgi:hypothetical protein
MTDPAPGAPATANNRARRSAPTRAALFILTIVAVAIGSYLFGVYSYPRGLWPASALRGLGDAVREPGMRDDFGRLTAYPGKIPVVCPPQGPETSVLLAMGQSNVANHAARRVTTRHGQAVVTYFEGTCHIAASPLLGATSDGGEFLTLLADRLVDDGLYRSVVIASLGVGGSPISRWARDGDLNAMLSATLQRLAVDYRVTHVIWHQGETDLANATTTDGYAAAFASLVETLDQGGVDAPIFTSVSTRCAAAWTATNSVARAQRALASGRRVFLATDTDALLTPDDRYDGCHYSESGQRKVAAAYATAIKRWTSTR